MDKEQLFNDLEQRFREGKMDRRGFLRQQARSHIASLGLTIVASLKGRSCRRSAEIYVLIHLL